MAHTYTNILIHALFSTKDRQPWLTPEIRDEEIPDAAPTGLAEHLGWHVYPRLARRGLQDVAATRLWITPNP